MSSFEAQTWHSSWHMISILPVGSLVNSIRPFNPMPSQEDHRGDFQRQNSLSYSVSYRTEMKPAIQFFIGLCITAPLFFWGTRRRQPGSHLMLSPLPRSSHFRFIRVDKVRAQSRKCCLALTWDRECPEQQYWGEVGREGWAGDLWRAKRQSFWLCISFETGGAIVKCFIRWSLLKYLI